MVTDFDVIMLSIETYICTVYLFIHLTVSEYNVLSEDFFCNVWAFLCGFCSPDISDETSFRSFKQLSSSVNVFYVHEKVTAFI